MKVILLLGELFNKIKRDEIISLSNEVTYKILLSFFPFIIFVMTVLGFLNIEGDFFIRQLESVLPAQIMNIIVVFNKEVIYTRNIHLLSISLLMAVVSASSGFRAIIRGVNKANGVSETRNFFSVSAASVFLMIIFTMGIVISLTLIILNDAIFSFLVSRFGLFSQAWIFTQANVLIVVICLLLIVLTIYRFAGCKRTCFFRNLPGAVFTVTLWIIASELFNIYINRFANYSKVYGSIGGVVILILWLNIISMILLVGGEINALCGKSGSKNISIGDEDSKC